ncbi:TolC family protein [Flammeovirga pectinis]|uniref:TolC family protein n=1 Tax=Flammeovirga pectinis TaxID=2494373 RepID=A0A3S9PBM3_9BACT|nr:TolC family protein [Flammeovirga pectinis]AZQ65529.1 TolC family protein [Flammeovirga pectinis]
MKKILYLKKISLFLILINLIGCLATKKYIAPSTENLSLFRLDSLCSTGENIGEISWGEFFSDSILKNYIDTALIYNINNKVAFKNIEKFRATMKKGKMSYLPTIGVNANYMRNNVSNNSFQGSFSPTTSYNDFTLESSIGWEADIWGKIKSKKLTSFAQFEKSITAQKTIQVQLIANLARTYYQLLEAEQSKELLLKTLDVRERSLSAIISLKEAGRSNTLAVSQAKAQLENVNILLTNIENKIFNLENALIILIGNKSINLKRTSLESQVIPASLNVGIPLAAISNRPDVKEAELDFKIAFEEYNVAKASLYPSLVLSANIGLNSLNAGDLFSANSFFYNFTGGLTQPLLNGRKLKTEKELKKLDQEIKLYSFQQKVLEASIEVSNYLNDYKTLTKNNLALKNQEDLLKKSLDDAHYLLIGGFANYLDILNAQENLLTIQLMHIESMSQKLQSTTYIFESVGGGKM